MSDLLAVYVFAGSDSVMPCRIFIWADKIARYVKDNTKSSNDVEELCELQSKEPLVITQITKKKRLLNIAPVWMHVKSQFNYDLACLLAEMWKTCLTAEKAYDDRTLTTKELETQRTNAVLSLSTKEQES